MACGTDGNGKITPRPAGKETMMNRTQIKQKQLSALILMSVLLLISGTILFRMDYAGVQEIVRQRNQMKLDSAAEMIRNMERMEEFSESSLASHTEKNVRFIELILKDSAAPEGYIGPHLFADGAVAEVSGDQVIFPDGVPEHVRTLSLDELRNGCEAVSDQFCYVSWAGEQRNNEDPYAFLNTEAFQKAAEQSFRGLLLGMDRDQNLTLIFASEEASGLFGEIDSRLAADQPKTVRAGGTKWICTYSRPEEDDLMLIWLMPQSPLFVRSVLHAALTMVSMLIIFVTLITYFFSVLSYTSTRSLSETEALTYHPKRTRRFLLTASLAGALVIFAIAAVVETMDAIHEDSIIGAKELSSIYAYSEQTVTERQREELRKEEQWYLNHGQRIAAYIAENRDTLTRQKLQEFSDLFGMDYLTLFDTNGRELVSSSDYVGLTMDEGLGENARDFRRLLKGAPGIVHGASLDPFTGLERTFAGVRVPLATKGGERGYGALMMAIDPGQFPQVNSDSSYPFRCFSDGNRFCFSADPQTGEILKAGDPSLEGRTVLSCGLPERSLQEGYTDFSVFDGVSSYTTMIRQEAADFFYVIYSAKLFSRTLPMAFAALLFYLAEALILGWFCLKDYRSEWFEQLITEENREIEKPNGKQAESSSLNDISELLVARSRSDTRWADKTPESQVGVILKADVLLLVILPLAVFDGFYGDSSLIRFILGGDWMRGVNMFSFCAIALVSTLGIMTLVVSNGILSMIAGFTGRAGETGCRMIYSLIYYLVILTILYHVFEYTGLAMSTYIASLGAVSLALSIGAQGMVADILAGLLIVFEHQFQVGDCIEIEEYRGKVLEIGVRSTRILGPGNEIRFISNSDIRSVINKSLRNLSHSKEFSFITQKSLEEVETLLAAALSEIGRRNEVFMDGPEFDGFVKAYSNSGYPAGRTITVRLRYECREQDDDRAENCITKEIIQFSEREGIGLC